MFAGELRLVNGSVAPGFEAVRKAFADNFVRRHELGGACCAYYRGEKVVDLWGGVRNKLGDQAAAVRAREEPLWQAWFNQRFS
jgi:hypothetical protein